MVYTEVELASSTQWVTFILAHYRGAADNTIMQGHDRLAYRQPQAGATSLLQLTRANLREWLEETALIFWSDAGPRVLDGVEDVVVIADIVLLASFDYDTDGRVLVAELDGVGKQVAEHVFQTEFIAVDLERGTGGKFCHHGDALGLVLRPNKFVEGFIYFLASNTCMHTYIHKYKNSII